MQHVPVIHSGDLSAQPIMSATSLVRGVLAGDPDAHVLAHEDPRVLMEGLTGLCLLLSEHLGRATGRSAEYVLDVIQATNIRAVAEGLATG